MKKKNLTRRDLLLTTSSAVVVAACGGGDQYEVSSADGNAVVEIDIDGRQTKLNASAVKSAAHYRYGPSGTAEYTTMGSNSVKYGLGAAFVKTPTPLPADYAQATAANALEPDKCLFKTSSVPAIALTDDPELYLTEVYGKTLKVTIRNLSNGDYRVLLRFAETFHTKPDKRVFNIKIQGVEVTDYRVQISHGSQPNNVVNALDIYGMVGSRKALDSVHKTNVNAGVMVVEMTAIGSQGVPADAAKLNAISVSRIETVSPTVTSKILPLNAGSIVYKDRTGKAASGTKLPGNEWIVEAKPAPGYRFAGWTQGFPTALKMINNQFVVIHTGAATFEASFEKYATTFNYANGNPLVRTHGAGDPEVQVFKRNGVDDELWMYCSMDHASATSDTYHRMDGYHAFSTADMVNWTDHGEIFHSRDMPKSPNVQAWGKPNGGHMWAPSVCKIDSLYWLFYPHLQPMDDDPKGQWYIAAASSSTPGGKFTYQGRVECKRNGTNTFIWGIDPCVYTDKDKIYLFFTDPSVHWVNLDPKNPTQTIDYSTSPTTDRAEPKKVEIKEIDETKNTRPLEGSFVHKHDDIYYLSWTNHDHPTHQAHYAVSDKVTGPYTYVGPMGTKPQGAQDHHAVAKFKGKWYFFYHIALADIPSTKNGQTRIACYDMLEYEGARSTTSTKLSFSKIKPIVPTMGPKGLATNSLINCGSALDVKSKAWNFLADTTNGKSKEYVIGGWGEGSSAIASDATANDFGDTTKSHRIGDKFIYFLNAKASTKYKIELVFVERLDLAARGTSGQSTREFSLFLNDEATSYYTYKSFENKLAVNQHLFVSVVGVSNISGQMKLDFRKSAKSVQNAFVSAIRMTAVP